MILSHSTKFIFFIALTVSGVRYRAICLLLNSFGLSNGECYMGHTTKRPLFISKLSYHVLLDICHQHRKLIRKSCRDVKNSVLKCGILHS